MRLDGTFEINAPRERVFQLLLDPKVLRRCMPGCEKLEAFGENQYAVSLRAGVGSIKGLFNGTVRIENISAPAHFRIAIDGRGQPGFMRGAANIDLADTGEMTRLTYGADVNVGGTLASVGQRMIQGSAKLMSTQFFTAFNAEAEAAHADEPPPKHGFFRTALRWFSGFLRRFPTRSRK